jgi:hypothetical protein
MLMRRIAPAALSLALLSAPLPALAAPALGTVEDWKGKVDPSDLSLGALAGMGILDSSAGFALLGTLSKKIDYDGWVPDIANSVSLEAEAGPLWVSGATAFQYSLHLRADFQRDADWTFYALGGLGGNVTPRVLGDRFILFPRFGIGAFYNVAGTSIAIRGEVSHELIAAGVHLPLYF